MTPSGTTRNVLSTAWQKPVLGAQQDQSKITTVLVDMFIQLGPQHGAYVVDLATRCNVKVLPRYVNVGSIQNAR